MTNLPLAKRTKGPSSRDRSNWQIKLGLRVAQFDQPGIYPMTVIVGADKTRMIVTQNGKIEDLGS